MIRELAPAKVNLVLQVGPRRADGLHEICSLFASLELADRVEVEPLEDACEDRIDCPGIVGPNLVATALAAYRSAAGEHRLPPLAVRVEKHVPVAAGLGGGSADAAASLRAAEALVDRPLGPEALLEVAMGVGADVPSQLEPGHAVVTGAGEHVEPVDLPPMWLALVPQPEGLATGRVYAEADRIGATRALLEPRRLLEASAARSLDELLPALENDLEPAALALRPELAEVVEEVGRRGAMTALLSGSGPTVFGVFAEREAAARAARTIEGALVTGLRSSRPDTARHRGSADRSPAGEPERPTTASARL